MADVDVIELRSSATAPAVLQRLAAEPGLVCLTGSGWSSTLISARPVEAAASVELLDRRPAGTTVFGYLGYDRPGRFALHDWTLRHDRSGWRLEVARSAPADTAAEAELLCRAALSATATVDGLWQVGPFSGSPRDDHLAAVEEAIGRIRAGDLYQVNICTRLGAEFTGSSVALFSQAVERLRPAYAGYLAVGAGADGAAGALVTLSPELFLQRRGRLARSSPIKGTRPRHENGGPAELRGSAKDTSDQLRGSAKDTSDQLRGSAKDTAENVMIVDLVRNDLGRVAEIGSVTVAELLEIQPHPGVWHLVSSVEATVREDVSDRRLLAATFPPGSVTGAPKIEAMRVIAELESDPRGVYTGAIGMVDDEGLTLNVAIRTFEIADGRIELGVGGGVTVDSVPALEWAETRHKADPLLDAIGASRRDEPPAANPTAAQVAGGLLETMLAVDGQVLRLSDHLSRIDLSCRELYGAPLPAGVRERVVAAATGGAGRVAVRLVIGPDLATRITVAPAVAPSAFADLETEQRRGLWRHKWADRSWITNDDALFVAEDGSVLETARGNVFTIDRDGVLVTAPLSDDLLPGVTRRALLDQARDGGWPVRLRTFTMAHLVEAQAAFVTSSLSGLVPIRSVDGRSLASSREAAERLPSWARRLGFPIGRNWLGEGR